MGLLDTLRSKLGQHPDKTSQGIDKAAGMADRRTGGKYGDQIRKGAEQVKDRLGAGDDRPEVAPEVTPDPTGEPPAGRDPGQRPPQPPQPQ